MMLLMIMMQVYQIAEGLGQNGLLCGLLYLLVPCAPIMMLRQEAREKYSIDGTTTNDAIASLCCGACVQCQVAAEVQQRK